MASCGGCCGGEAKFEGLSSDYKRRLWAVIIINAAMFFIETGGGSFAGSVVLIAFGVLDTQGATILRRVC